MIPYPRALQERAWRKLFEIERDNPYRVVAATLTHGPNEHPLPMVDVVVVGEPASYYRGPLMRKAVWTADPELQLVVRVTELAGLLERARPAADCFDSLLCDPLFMSPRYGQPLVYDAALAQVSGELLHLSPQYLRTALKRQRLDGVLRAVEERAASGEVAGRWLSSALFAASEISTDMSCVSTETGPGFLGDPLAVITPSTIQLRMLRAGAVDAVVDALVKAHYDLWRNHFTMTDVQYHGHAHPDTVTQRWMRGYERLGQLVEEAPGIKARVTRAPHQALMVDSLGGELRQPDPPHAAAPTGEAEEDFLL